MVFAKSSGCAASAATDARVMVIGQRCPVSTWAAIYNFAARMTSAAPPAGLPWAVQVELCTPAWALRAISS